MRSCGAAGRSAILGWGYTRGCTAHASPAQLLIPRVLLVECSYVVVGACAPTKPGSSTGTPAAALQLLRHRMQAQEQPELRPCHGGGVGQLERGYVGGENRSCRFIEEGLTFVG
jgi:hypothetical protein